MVEYNKKIYKKRDGRTLVASGPRAAQDRHQNQAHQQTDLDELHKLRQDIEAIASNIPSNLPSNDVMATKIDEAIEEISAELEQRYIDKIKLLEKSLDEKTSQIKKLEEKLDKKDDLIETLTKKINTTTVVATTSTVIEEESDRPGMDKIFIDPTKKGSEDKLESHVKIKEVQSSKPAVSDNINKLKSLMGKLPK